MAPCMGGDGLPVRLRRYCGGPGLGILVDGCGGKECDAMFPFSLSVCLPLLGRG